MALMSSVTESDIAAIRSWGKAGKELMERPARQKATTSAANRMNVDGRKFLLLLTVIMIFLRSSCFFEVMMFYILMRTKYGWIFFETLAK
jgi:hypothetical protein